MFIKRTLSALSFCNLVLVSPIVGVFAYATKTTIPQISLVKSASLNELPTVINKLESLNTANTLPNVGVSAVENDSPKNKAGDYAILLVVFLVIVLLLLLLWLLPKLPLFPKVPITVVDPVGPTKPGFLEALAKVVTIITTGIKALWSYLVPKIPSIIGALSGLFKWTMSASYAMFTQLNVWWWSTAWPSLKVFLNWLNSEWYHYLLVFLTPVLYWAVKTLCKVALTVGSYVGGAAVTTVQITTPLLKKGLLFVWKVVTYVPLKLFNWYCDVLWSMVPAMFKPFLLKYTWAKILAYISTFAAITWLKTHIKKAAQDLLIYLSERRKSSIELQDMQGVNPNKNLDALGPVEKGQLSLPPMPAAPEGSTQTGDLLGASILNSAEEVSKGLKDHTTSSEFYAFLKSTPLDVFGRATSLGKLGVSLQQDATLSSASTTPCPNNPFVGQIDQKEVNDIISAFIEGVDSLPKPSTPAPTVSDGSGMESVSLSDAPAATLPIHSEITAIPEMSGKEAVLKWLNELADDKVISISSGQLDMISKLQSPQELCSSVLKLLFTSNVDPSYINSMTLMATMVLIFSGVAASQFNWVEFNELAIKQVSEFIAKAIRSDSISEFFAKAPAVLTSQNGDDAVKSLLVDEIRSTTYDSVIKQVATKVDGIDSLASNLGRFNSINMSDGKFTFMRGLAIGLTEVSVVAAEKLGGPVSEVTNRFVKSPVVHECLSKAIRVVQRV